MSSRKKTPTGNYSVGYCKPPEATRFKPGVSGNPNGPKNSSIGISKIASVLAEKREVIDRGKTRRMTVEEVFYHIQKDKALKGDLKATQFLLNEHQRQCAQKCPDDEYDLTLLSDDELQLLHDILAKAVRKN